MFDFLFGKNKGSSGKKGSGGQSTAAMQNLDDAIDLLDKKEAMLQKRIDDELNKAKQFHAKKNTARALDCMKRKKTYEEQMTRITAQRANLETQKIALENQQLNLEVVNAQKKAADEMKKVNKKMDADKIEDQMDKLTEEMEKANMVSEALANPIDNSVVVDEDDLMNELEMELANDNPEEEDDLTELLNNTKIPQSAPGKKVNNGMSKAEADALAELEAELAG